MTSRGFTLLEVLVALVVTGLVSISVLGAVSGATRASERAARAVVASELADERLASLLTLPPPVVNDSADGRSWNVAGMIGWRWSADLTPHPSGLRILSVRVSGGPGPTTATRTMFWPSEVP